jgi:hypothetical protein
MEHAERVAMIAGPSPRAILWTYGLVVVIVLSSGALYLGAQIGGAEYTHQKVSTALEAYFIDHNAYPAWEYKAYRARLVPTFKNTCLTTPIPYLPKMPIDVFSFDENHWYSYYSVNARREGDRSGWILISAGPDEDYDMDPVREFDVNSTATIERALFHHYDPTNGTISSGDLITLRQ